MAGPHEQTGRDQAGQGGPQTLAAALFQTETFALGRSFRLQRPRGAFCHRGWCQQCKVVLSDGTTALACTLPPDAAGRVAQLPRWHKGFGLLARFLPPWFHERFLLPVGWAQQVFHRIVRNATGALPISAPTSTEVRATRAVSRTVVVGNGAAGRSAAAALAAAGEECLLLGTHPAAPGATGEHGEATVLGLYPGQEGAGWTMLCAVPGGSLLVAFERLVIATGAYDRLPAIPGNDLPGIIAADAFLDLLDQDAVPAGVRIGLFAPAETVARLTSRAGARGRKIAWACAPTAVADRRPIRAQGQRRLTGVTFSDGTREACDVLVVAYRQTAYELMLQAGMTAAYDGDGAPVRATGEARLPLLVVGEAAGDGLEGMEDATRARVRDWLATGAAPAPVAVMPMPQPETLDDDLIVCPCEDVTVREVRQAVADGFDNIEHLKRRTGAATGPCQGKLCHSMLMRCLSEAGAPAGVPTMRPLARPVKLKTLADTTK